MTELENLRNLARETHEMRRVQIRFFAGDKSAACVQDAKRLEKRVDRTLDALFNGDLFAEEERA